MIIMVGSDLRQWLKARRITQGQAAQQLRMSQGAISHWLTGRRQPGAESLARLTGWMARKELEAG